MLPRSALVKQDSGSGWEVPDQPLKVGFTVEIPDFATKTCNRLFLPSALFQASSRPVFVYADYKTPVYFEYAYRIVDRVKITLPSGLAVDNLPTSQPAKTEFS